MSALEADMDWGTADVRYVQGDWQAGAEAKLFVKINPGEAQLRNGLKRRTEIARFLWRNEGVAARSGSLFQQREVGNVGTVPAVHRLRARPAIGVAALPERNVAHDQLILSSAIGAFEDGHANGGPVLDVMAPTQQALSPLQPISLRRATKLERGTSNQQNAGQCFGYCAGSIKRLGKARCLASDSVDVH